MLIITDYEKRLLLECYALSYLGVSVEKREKDATRDRMMERLRRMLEITASLGDGPSMSRREI